MPSLNEKTNKPKTKKKDGSRVQCYRRDKFGHFASQCLERKAKQEEANMDEVDDHDPHLLMLKKTFTKQCFIQGESDTQKI